MENVLFRAVFLADTHIRAARYRKAILLPGLYDASRRLKPDLLAVAGDCTDTGSEENWAAFRDTLRRGLPGTRTLLAIGNHDTWEAYDGAHDYGPARTRFLRYANDLMGTSLDEVFYSTDCAGYPFFVLGSEGTGVGMHITDRQLDRLSTALSEAARRCAGKPFFVICHSPLNHTHGVGENLRGHGIETPGASERLRDILDAYENVFLFSGHLHFGLSDGNGRFPGNGFLTVERAGARVVSVNLPCYEYGGLGSRGLAPIGEGVIADVEPDAVRLRGRNLITGRWSKKIDLRIKLK